MNSLFEIPIYGLSPSALNNRFLARKKSIEIECADRNVSPTHARDILELETYPCRMWQYNHIVGFIRISIDGQDMNYEVFLPVGQRERYRWLSSRKVFMYDIHANGTHFYLGNTKTNDIIQQRLVEMLHEVIKQHVPKRYYVDTSTFDSTYRHIDYMSIIREVTTENADLQRTISAELLNGED